MKKKTCAYSQNKLDAKFKCPSCAGPVDFEIRQYFIRPKNGSKNMHLCREHAGWWNDGHPFGPTAIPNSAPAYKW